MIKVSVTGAAGQIAYNLLFRIAAGEMFGSHPVSLELIDLPGTEKALEGVRMELEDSAFPLLREVDLVTKIDEAFSQADFALLIGSKPRGPGMERKDLLTENGHIFVAQGKQLGKAAKKSVRVLVVGNPCNTNCLIAAHHAPSIPRSHFFAMTRLDQNRAAFQLAAKAKREISSVSHMAIWGNHSSTQVPDFEHAMIGGKRAEEVIADRGWFEEVFIPLVQKRGAEVIAARGKSSAGSAASAILDAVRAIHTPPTHWFSSGVESHGNPYGIHTGLIFSFPCHLTPQGVSIVRDLAISPFLEKLLKRTETELLEERDMVRGLLK